MAADTGWLDEEASLQQLDVRVLLVGWLLVDWTGIAGERWLDAVLRGIIFAVWLDVETPLLDDRC